MPIPSWKSGLQEIAPNVFAYIHSGVGWDICNSGFIVSDDGVMVIDAMMVASMVRPYLEEIRRVTDQPNLNPVFFILGISLIQHFHISTPGDQGFSASAVGNYLCRKVELVAKGMVQMMMGVDYVSDGLISDFAYLLRTNIARYAAQFPRYRRLMEQAGFTQELKAVRRLWNEGNQEEARRLIPTELIEKIALVGSADQCRRKLDEYRRAGITQPIISPRVAGPNPKDEAMQIIRACAPR